MTAFIMLILFVVALFASIMAYQSSAKNTYMFKSNEYLRGVLERTHERYAKRDRQLNSLRDDVRDTITILAKHRPIDFDVYKLLVAECQCDYCRELFQDYLDMSEGSATDVAPLIAAGEVAAPEEATARGNTAELPTPVLLVNPEV